ncbi:hypothetical protein N9811_04975 [Bacteroidia bacterium]|nr:hypothetical protein [Bacteroidia bacterium]
MGKFYVAKVYLSFFKDTRQQAAEVFGSKKHRCDINADELKEAYQFSRIINHHQGFSLIKNVSDKHKWNVRLSNIAQIWTEGCIIKSDLMKEIARTLTNDTPLLFTKPWASQLKASHAAIQKVVTSCIASELHTPCLMEALNYFHGVKIADRSANIIQAQRDYFGAHTYERKDDSSGKKYHSDWTSEV